jgi:hypothetical protein
MPNRVEQGTSRKILLYNQGYPAIITGVSLLQGKTVTITGLPCLFLVLPCSALQGTYKREKYQVPNLKK